MTNDKIKLEELSKVDFSVSDISWLFDCHLDSLSEQLSKPIHEC